MVVRFWVRTGVKGALLRRGRLLVLRRRDDSEIWPGLWDLPGGGVEKEDGSLEKALAREFLEETGLRVRVGPVLNVSLQWVPVLAEPTFPSIRSCFLCTTRSRREPCLDSSEHSEYAWVTKGDLGGLRAIPNLRRAMQLALRGTP